METLHGVATADTGRRLRLWLGVALLGVGLLGHLLSAQAIGGYYVAYRDHIFGFFLLTTITGVIIAGLGWPFWRRRHDITLLTLGGVQAILGLVVWLNRFAIG
jgi:hypothetical protein